MTIKRVRLNENVHTELLNLKEKNNVGSINDAIEALLQITGDIDLKTAPTCCRKDSFNQV